MFKKITKKDKRTKLEMEIDEVLEYMEDISPDSDEYGIIVENLERLYKAKANDRTRQVSPDTMAIIAGNILGIAIILTYEKANVITSKALGFVLKGRV